MLFDYLNYLDGLPESARVCHVCGSADLEVDVNPFQLRAVGHGGDPGDPSGPIQLCAMVVCRDCHVIRLHAISVAK